MPAGLLSRPAIAAALSNLLRASTSHRIDPPPSPSSLRRLLTSPPHRLLSSHGRRPTLQTLPRCRPRKSPPRALIPPLTITGRLPFQPPLAIRPSPPAHRRRISVSVSEVEALFELFKSINGSVIDDGLINKVLPHFQSFMEWQPYCRLVFLRNVIGNGSFHKS
ncbi:hypothetical protein DAI22_11g050901 [Oryza sativa Japonica Group]|nr:hypothetical protein DAI22_11g050901 [Oryza sativa Japonica Group]